MILEQFKVDSESSPGAFYVVSKVMNNDTNETFWQCSCIGWTRHVPRRDCKHITYHRTFGGRAYDPLVASILKVRKAAERKAEKARLAEFASHPIARMIRQHREAA